MKTKRPKKRPVVALWHSTPCLYLSSSALGNAMPGAPMFLYILYRIADAIRINSITQGYRYGAALSARTFPS